MRYAHSVKSEASFLGYEEVAELAHGIEDGLSPRTARPVAELKHTLDELEHAFAEALDESHSSAAEADGGTAPTEPAEELIGSRLSVRDRELIAEARERGERLFILECELTEHPQMLAPRRYLLVGNLEQEVNLILNYPEVKDEAPIRRFVALFSFEGDRSVAEQAVDIDQVSLVRLDQIDYDTILRRNDETLASGMIAATESVRIEMSTRAYEELCLYAAELRRQLDYARKHLVAGESRDQNLSGLIDTTARLADSVDATIARTSMTPLAPVFSHVERYTRNIASFLDKSVRIITGGGPQQVFLPVAEVLRDVLLHLVRNAVDHGIESRDERRQAGKDPAATIQVTSRIEGESLVVRVSDDGRGVRPEDVATGDTDLGAGEIWDIVSQPGVSTREAADRVSGRGVGLDVVRTQVERYLGGRVDFETNPGVGTTVSIRLPRASRLISVLVARHGRTEFALPSAHVFALLDLEARFASRDRANNLFYRYHGDAIRVYAVERSSMPPTVEGLRGVLIRIGRRRAIVLADEVLSQETVIRNADQPNRVFSQAMNRDVGLVFPVQFL